MESCGPYERGFLVQWLSRGTSNGTSDVGLDVVVLSPEVCFGASRLLFSLPSLHIRLLTHHTSWPGFREKSNPLSCSCSL
jgi:hypothetical protein